MSEEYGQALVRSPILLQTGKAGQSRGAHGNQWAGSRWNHQVRSDGWEEVGSQRIPSLPLASSRAEMRYGLGTPHLVPVVP